MEDGYLTVPNKPGIGVEPDQELIESLSTFKETIT
jgi:L-alanine-DL-glutamate epimerase-like enolase superfamily enzyme